MPSEFLRKGGRGAGLERGNFKREREEGGVVIGERGGGGASCKKSRNNPLIYEGRVPLPSSNFFNYCKEGKRKT